MSSVFGGGSKVEAPPVAPTTTDASAEATKAEQQRQQQARAAGYNSTILTGPGDSNTPTVKNKNLLGI